MPATGVSAADVTATTGRELTPEAATQATQPATGDFGDVEDFAQLDLAALLDAEVDTGSGFKRKLSEVPAIVEVYTREELEHLGIRDINELLSRLTGVYRQPANQENIIIHASQLRGGGVSDKILILIDDHGALDELDDTYAPYSIPIESIERVEFLRGPAAVLYGSSAMGGVLRIKTRRGERIGGEALVLASPFDDGGEVSLAGIYGDGAGDGPDLRIDVQARQTELMGAYIPEDLGGESGTFPRQATYVSSLATARWNGWYLRLQNHWMETRIIGFQTQLSFNTPESTLQLHGAEIGYEKGFGEWRWKNRIALDYRSRSMGFGEFPPFGFSGRSGDELQTTVVFDGLVAEAATSVGYDSERWNLLSGLLYRHLRSLRFGFFFADETNNPFFPPDDIEAYIHDANVFVQGGVSPTDELSLLAGLRLNYYDRGTSDFIDLDPEDRNPDPLWAPMGRAAVVYKPRESLALKALYGRAFRLPTIFESYATVRGIVDPAPDLEPEIQDTVELATDIKPSDELFLRVNGYYNRVYGSIEIGDNPDPDGASRYHNQEDYFNTYGLESSIRWVAGSWAHVFGSYSLMRGVLEDGTVMDSIPNQLIKGGATFFAHQRRLSVTPFLNYVGEYYNAGKDLTLNVHSRYRIWKDVSLLATVENLGNEPEYLPYYNGIDTPPVDSHVRDGRFFRFGIHAKF